MTIAWAYCVATWFHPPGEPKARLYLMSDWYTCKLAAQDEYEQMGKSMNYYVMQGKAWIYRHPYRVVDDQTGAAREQPESSPEPEPESSPVSSA
jgi:hypothetical protein